LANKKYKKLLWVSQQFLFDQPTSNQLCFTAYLLESSPPSTSIAFLRVTDADYGSNGDVEVTIKTISLKHEGSFPQIKYYLLW